MTLPRDVLDDPTDESLWNLVGAWQLGIERRFGGSIGSLDLDVVPHPDRAGERALLLSDAVPGGTGYLMELAEAPQVWSILVGALDALRDCACQEEGLAACHRCLLPQVPRRDVPWCAATSPSSCSCTCSGRSRTPSGWDGSP